MRKWCMPAREAQAMQRSVVFSEALCDLLEESNIEIITAQVASNGSQINCTPLAQYESKGDMILGAQSKKLIDGGCRE